MVIVFVPMIYVLTQRFGVTGAATSWVLLNLAYVIVVARLMHRRLLTKEMKEWYTKDLLLPLLAAATAAFILRQIFPVQAGSLVAILFLGLSLTGILISSSLAANHVRTELAGRLHLSARRA